MQSDQKPVPGWVLETVLTKEFCGKEFIDNDDRCVMVFTLPYHEKIYSFSFNHSKKENEIRVMFEIVMIQNNHIKDLESLYRQLKKSDPRQYDIASSYRGEMKIKSLSIDDNSKNSFQNAALVVDFIKRIHPLSQLMIEKIKQWMPNATLLPTSEIQKLKTEKKYDELIKKALAADWDGSADILLNLIEDLKSMKLFDKLYSLLKQFPDTNPHYKEAMLELAHLKMIKGNLSLDQDNDDKVSILDACMKSEDQDTFSRLFYDYMGGKGMAPQWMRETSFKDPRFFIHLANEFKELSNAAALKSHSNAAQAQSGGLSFFSAETMPDVEMQSIQGQSKEGVTKKRKADLITHSNAAQAQSGGLSFSAELKTDGETQDIDPVTKKIKK